MMKVKDKLDAIIEQETRDDAIPITRKNDMLHAFENLDNPEHVDKNTFIKGFERSAIMSCEGVHSLGLNPFAGALAQSFKKHSISINGMGMENKVRIAVAEREAKLGKRQGLMGALGGLFTPKEGAK